MAYTKYSLTPADNNAAPPNGAPEGMLPSGVNDTMRDMMAQIRDVGDGIRGGTYTMTAPVITGGSITGVALSGNTLTNPVITGGAISTSTLTGNTFTNPVISGGSINNTPIGATTANTGKFTTLETTGVATMSAGTASAPAITTTGDTNTGIFFPAADTIAFTEGGTERMRITDAGRVGINTSSPDHVLDVRGSGVVSTKVQSSDNSAQIILNSSGTNVSYINYGQTGANPLAFYDSNAGAERMRITSGGDLYVGSSSPTFGSRFVVVKNGGDVVGFGNTSAVAGETVLTVKGGANTTDTTTTYIIFQRADGTTRGSIVATGTNGVVYNTSSDYRLKENIAPMTGALAKVQALKPVIYKWKEDGLDGQGFIAHELAEVFPDAVTGEKDAVDAKGKIKPQGIDTSVLVATLAAAIQELKATVDAQAARIAALENK
jgi:hypothetical protein